MKIFATRVWGYDPDTWPLVTFSGEAIANNLLKASTADDIVVFVGTLKEPTQERDRGRLVGFCQFGRHLIDSLDVLQEENLLPEHYENGVFKWPKALVMTRAWVFDDDPQPELKKVFEKQLPFQAISQAVLLSEYDSDVVKNLKATEVEVPETEALAKVKRLNVALSRPEPTTGVFPIAWKSLVERKLGQQASTYLLRFGKTNCWKVGWALEPKKRLTEINKHIPYEVIEQKWHLHMWQPWPDEKMAFEMEQRILNATSTFRSIGERLICSQQDIESIWTSKLI